MPQMKETSQTAEGQVPSAVANTLGFGVRHGSLTLALRSCRSLGKFSPFSTPSFSQVK